MSTATGAAIAATQEAVRVMATDNVTFLQLTGVLVFCIAIGVGCMLADAIFRRY